MIFRTITDDITGANKPIGLFGRSLDDFKGIINSFKQNGFVNTLLNTPLINIDTDAINSYNNAIKSGISYELALAGARETTNTSTLALIESSHGAEVQIERVNAVQKASTIAAKAHSAALKAVSIAGNVLLFSAITKGIQLAATAIDNYIHRVEKSRERTDKLFSEFQQMNDTLAGHKKTVSELADRYDELSKGVSSTDNSNISLSDKEYNEFLDINRQLVDIFPELYHGLGENGSSLLKIGTNAQSASEYLQELIDKEENLNNIKIANNLDELFKNVAIQVKDSNTEISELEQELNNLDVTWENAALMKDGDISGLDKLKVGDNTALQNVVSKSIQQLHDELYAKFQNNQIDTDTYTNFVERFVNPALYDDATLFDGYIDLTSLDNKQKQRLQEIIQEQTKALMPELNDSVSAAMGSISLEKQNINAIWVDFIPNFISAMKSQANFQELEKAGLGDFAVLLVEQLDTGLISELNGTAYEDDIYGYVRDKILVPFQNAIKDESGNLDTTKLENIKKQLSDALNLKTGFDNSDISLAKYVDEVNAFISVLEELGMSPDIIKNVKILFDYDNVSDIQERMDNSVNKISGYQQDNWGRGINDTKTLEDKKKLQDYINKLTREQYQLWLDVTAGIQDADNAINAFEQVSKDAGEVISEPVSNTDLINSFSKMKDNVKSVSEIISAINDEEPLDLSLLDISNFEGFEGLEEELSEFIDTVSSAPDNMEAAQEAANDLVDAYIRQEKFVSVLRDGNKELAISMLEQIGVTNAAIIVEEELAKQEADLYLQKQDIASAISDENAFTEERIQTLIYMTYKPVKILHRHSTSVAFDKSAVCM